MVTRVCSTYRPLITQQVRRFGNWEDIIALPEHLTPDTSHIPRASEYSPPINEGPVAFMAKGVKEHIKKEKERHHMPKPTYRLPKLTGKHPYGNGTK